MLGDKIREALKASPDFHNRFTSLTQDEHDAFAHKVKALLKGQDLIQMPPGHPLLNTLVVNNHYSLLNDFPQYSELCLFPPHREVFITVDTSKDDIVFTEARIQLVGLLMVQSKVVDFLTEKSIKVRVHYGITKELMNLIEELI